MDIHLWKVAKRPTPRFWTWMEQEEAIYKDFFFDDESQDIHTVEEEEERVGGGQIIITPFISTKQRRLYLSQG